MKRGIQERIAHQLRNRISRGELMPGAVLSEGALAQEFGASRTPVREALKQLQAEGLIVIRPRVGTFVAAPSRLEINELFEVKEILEGAAGEYEHGNAFLRAPPPASSPTAAPSPSSSSSARTSAAPSMRSRPATSTSMSSSSTSTTT